MLRIKIVGQLVLWIMFIFFNLMEPEFSPAWAVKPFITLLWTGPLRSVDALHQSSRIRFNNNLASYFIFHVSSSLFVCQWKVPVMPCFFPRAWRISWCLLSMYLSRNFEGACLLNRASNNFSKGAYDKQIIFYWPKIQICKVFIFCFITLVCMVNNHLNTRTIYFLLCAMW
jgi:hypothetical protein